MAAILLQIVLTKTDIRDSAFLSLMRADVSGAIQPDFVVTLSAFPEAELGALTAMPPKAVILKVSQGHRHSRM